MSLSLPEFENVMNLSKKFVDEVVKDVQVNVTGMVYEAVLETTPVLTGKARRNWNLSIQTADVTTVEDVAGVSSTGVPMTGAEKERMRALASALRNLPMGQKVFVANGLPYVPGLDAGTSAKAPYGIREIAITRVLEGRSSVNKQMMLDFI